MRSFRFLFLFLPLVFAACQNEPTRDLRDILPADPIPEQEGDGNVPIGGGLIPFSNEGGFTFTGPTAPGGASVLDAPVVDPEGGGEPAGGTFDVTVDGTQYQDDLALSMATVITDDTDGKTYAIWVAMQQAEDGTATMVEVIVPVEDAVAGATVALDGDQRVALFFHGNMELPEPEVVAAAVSGTVTFSAGAAVIGQTLTASVAGDFGPVDFEVGGGGGGGGGGGNNLVSGDYTLTFQSPAQVQCDGSLAGQETAFAGIGLVDLGFGSGAVSLDAQDAANATIAGPAILAGFAASPLAMTAEAGEGMMFAVTEQTGDGPAGTHKIGHYLVLDADGATASGTSGGAGAGYETGDGAGWCSVAFGAQLSAN